MFARIVRLAAVAVIVLLSMRSMAAGAPPPAGEPNVLNRQLAAMVLPAPSRPAIPSVFVAASPRAAADHQRLPTWLSSAAFLALAARFTSAERILHYRHGGFDANFWGVLNRGHNIRLEFSARL